MLVVWGSQNKLDQFLPELWKKKEKEKVEKEKGMRDNLTNLREEKERDVITNFKIYEAMDEMDSRQLTQNQREE